jgi:exodeoxyribonuclease VII large subunit
MQLNLAEFELGVSEFVELVNQTFEYAISSVVITGELANLRVSKNKWVYFDLKDEGSSVKFFGTVYMLPGPLEDGMLLRVRGQPKLHNLYGFSVNVMSIQPAGEGSIKRAAQLLQMQLEKEGLFDAGRKRLLPYPPRRIGLITSKQSAAYADFIKILNARWQGLAIELIDVQVQGEVAPAQITAALEQFNEEAEPPDVLVLIRGGGSPEDLAAFSSEQVTRAVAASRVPTLVAIGHEIDTSLAELAADVRASTPSNAAELLVPDRANVLASLPQLTAQLSQSTRHHIRNAQRDIRDAADALSFAMNDLLAARGTALRTQEQLLAALSPQAILRRGYAVVRHDSQPVRDVAKLTAGDIVEVQLASGRIRATTEAVTKKEAQNDKRQKN